MKTATVVFSSVCGNTFLLAQEFARILMDRGISVLLRRVYDDDLDKIALQFEVAREFLSEIKSVPLARAEDLLEADLVVLGSPTYFGNVSAEMKAFMDSTAPLWMGAKLSGKRLMAFATAANYEGGAHLCLKAIENYGVHVGMISMPFPAHIMADTLLPAYGLVHYTGEVAANRPTTRVFAPLSRWIDWVIAQNGS